MMAGEKATGNQPANPSGGNANKGASKSNRRRSLRSKRRGRKPEEASESREPRGEAREPREARAQANAPKSPEKSVRDNRERRRRRRMRSKQRGQSETTAPVVEDVLKDLPPLVPAFVYTHVLRPAMRDSFEFRTEHFSKVTRKMEDFHIDLSPLYPDGGDEIKGVAYMPPLDPNDYGEDFDKEYEGDLDEGALEDEPDDLAPDYGVADRSAVARPAAALDREVAGDLEGELDVELDDEELDDPDWDAEQIEDAAQLDGATTGAVADEFYSELDDSVLDEYPEEDIDA